MQGVVIQEDKNLQQYLQHISESRRKILRNRLPVTTMKKVQLQEGQDLKLQGNKHLNVGE